MMDDAYHNQREMFKAYSLEYERLGNILEDAYFKLDQHMLEGKAPEGLISFPPLKDMYRG